MWNGLLLHLKGRLLTPKKKEAKENSSLSDSNPPAGGGKVSNGTLRSEDTVESEMVAFYMKLMARSCGFYPLLNPDVGLW